MTDPGDPSGEMARFLSPPDADRLLAGEAGSESLPGDTETLARLLSSMRDAAADADPVAEARMVATIAAEIRRSASAIPAPRASGFGRRISLRAATAGFAAMLVSGTALAHVHISVPHPPTDAKSDPHGRSRTGPQPSTDPSTTSARDAGTRYGLCNAAGRGPSSAASHKARSGSVAFSNLEKAAAAAGMTVSQYCTGVAPPGHTPTIIGRGHGVTRGSTPGTRTHGPPPSKPKGGQPHPTTPSGKGNGKGQGKGQGKGVGTGSSNAGGSKGKSPVTGSGNSAVNGSGNSRGNGSANGSANGNGHGKSKP